MRDNMLRYAGIPSEDLLYFSHDNTALAALPYIIALDRCPPPPPTPSKDLLYFGHDNTGLAALPYIIALDRFPPPPPRPLGALQTNDLDEVACVAYWANRPLSIIDTTLPCPPEHLLERLLAQSGRNARHSMAHCWGSCMG